MILVPKEQGILWRDGVYFCSADQFTKENLFYILWGAVYSLDKPYCVNRNYMDAFMLQYIISGELNFKFRGKTFTAMENEVVLLSCQEKNLYWSEKPATVKWFHFNGKAVSPLLEYIYEKNNGTGYFRKDHAKKIENYVDCIIDAIRKNRSNSFHLSHYIYSILCELATPPEYAKSPAEKTIQSAITFIQDNYNKPISVSDIAKSINLSVYYFTRLFTKYMHTSPHNYLLTIRLEAAKRILIYTFDDVETISLRVGFESASHFIRAFKKANNITPSNFRKVFYIKKTL